MYIKICSKSQPEDDFMKKAETCSCHDFSCLLIIFCTLKLVSDCTIIYIYIYILLIIESVTGISHLINKRDVS